MGRSRSEMTDEMLREPDDYEKELLEAFGIDEAVGRERLDDNDLREINNNVSR